MAKFELIDRAHNVYECNRCGTLHRFEADGVLENGFQYCPYCGNKLRLPAEHQTRFIGLGENQGICVPIEEALDYALEQCGVTLDEDAPDAAAFREEFLHDFVAWFFSGDWFKLYGDEDEEAFVG